MFRKGCCLFPGAWFKGGRPTLLVLVANPLHMLTAEVDCLGMGKISVGEEMAEKRLEYGGVRMCDYC